MTKRQSIPLDSVSEAIFHQERDAFLLRWRPSRSFRWNGSEGRIDASYDLGVDREG